MLFAYISFRCWSFVIISPFKAYATQCAVEKVVHSIDQNQLVRLGEPADYPRRLVP
jgi:hypothetical protein